MYCRIKKLALIFIVFNLFMVQSVVADMLFYYNAAVLPAIVSTKQTDTTPPEIIVFGNNPESVLQGETYIDAGATAIDDRDGSVTVATTGSVDTSTIGTYTITYTATDSANNTVTATRTVNVVLPPDTTPPEITVLGDNPATVIQSTTYTDAGATAIDDRDGSVTVVTTGSVDTSTIGTYTITYTATDSANNTATATRTVNVVLPPDTTPPEITVLGDNPESVFQGEVYIDAGAIAVDDRDGSVTVVTTGSVDTSTIGTYTITYTATDSANNTATATRTVNVVLPPDTTPPVITVLGDNPVTVIQNTTYADAGATAIDDRDGSVTVVTTGNVDTSTIGTYTITYTATDSANNTATATRTVNVVLPPDTTPPEITVIGNNPESVFQGEVYIDAGAIAVDNLDGDITNLIQSVSTVDTSRAGTYTVTYTVSDYHGNSAKAVRSVIVDGTSLSILYEDAEDGNIIGWSIYDNDPSGASITNIYDDVLDSRVIELLSTSTQNGFILRKELADGSFVDWDNNINSVLELKMKFLDRFKIYIEVNTLEGDRFIIYANYPKPLNNPDDVYLWYDISNDVVSGEWQTFSRDLRADLQNLQPSNDLTEVDALRVKGSMRLDDIQLTGGEPATILTKVGVIKRASDESRVYDLEAIRYIESNNEFIISDDSGHLLYRLNLETEQIVGIMDELQFVTYTENNPNPDSLSLCHLDASTGNIIGFCDVEGLAYDQFTDEIYVFTGNKPGDLSTFKLSRSAPDQNFTISDWKRIDHEHSSAVMINDQLYTTIYDTVIGKGKVVVYDWDSDTDGETIFETTDKLVDLAYNNGDIWILTDSNILYEIRFFDMAFINSYNMTKYDINDPRAVEIVGNQLYIGDGDDTRTDDLGHAIHIFDLP